ncbi:hypothetical protein AAIA72_12500 [Hahella sp. SMD15-11]|uniref:Uncharacterized protein n=1 Tax=Thermohahella caldifontis TaxID=3142973 RepID=A0AB39UU91_9GAMM
MSRYWLLLGAWASAVFASADDTHTVTVTVSPDLYVSFEERQVPDACHTSPGSCEVNGTPRIGAISAPPDSYLSRISLRYKDRTYLLDSGHMYNPQLAGRAVPARPEGWVHASCMDAENCVVRVVLGDAGDTYVAEWYVLDGKSLRTLLSPSEDLINLFMKDIRPPVYE